MTRPEPPANVQAEEAVLACAMLGPEALAWAAGHLSADDFYRPAHRAIYAVLHELHGDGQPVNPPTVMAALDQRGALADVGGAPFLAALAGLDVTPANVGYFGRQVLEVARRRALIDLGSKAAMLGYEEPDPDRALALTRALLDELEQGGTDESTGPVEVLHSMVEARAEADTDGRVRWHLPSLDRLTGGLVRRRLIVVGARPGVGKSSLGLQVAALAAESARVLFVSYEMGLAEIGQHHMAMYGDLATDDALALIDHDRLSSARAIYQRLDLAVIDSVPDLDRLVGQVSALHARRPLDLVVVDYLQLVPVKLAKGANREQEVAAVSRALALLANRLNVPVLALAQVNRDADGRVPTLRDLRESGAIENNAHQIIFLHDEIDPSGDRTGVVLAVVAKNRMGRLGEVRLRFDRPKTVFSDDLAPESQWGRDPSGTR